MAAVIGRDFDLDLLARATKTTEDDLLDILDAAAAVALVRELADTPGITTSPTPSSSTPCTRTSVRPAGRGHTGRWPKPWRTSAATVPGAGWANWPATGSAPPNPSTWPRPSATPARRATPPSVPWPPPTRCATTPRPSTSTPRSADPDPVLGIDLAIGLGTAQRQTGDPAFRDTLLDAARRAADLGDTERLVAAALANDRGCTSSSGVIDTDKVEVLEMALDRLSADDPDRALVLATLCSELTFGSPLERRQALADEALAIAESSGDDAIIVRVLNQVSSPLLVPSTARAALARTADALVRAERVGDPVLLFFAAHCRATAVFWPGTSTRWTAASRSWCSWPSSSISRF